MLGRLENLTGQGDHVHHDYLCRLSPLASPNCDRFYRLEFLRHYIVPLAFLLDTVIFDKSRQYRWFDPISGRVCLGLHGLLLSLMAFLENRYSGIKEQSISLLFLNVFYGHILNRCVLIIFAAIWFLVCLLRDKIHLFSRRRLLRDMLL